jgi:hypothetical protein
LPEHLERRDRPIELAGHAFVVAVLDRQPLPLADEILLVERELRMPRRALEFRRRAVNRAQADVGQRKARIQLQSPVEKSDRLAVCAARSRSDGLTINLQRFQRRRRRAFCGCIEALNRRAIP